MYRKLILIRHGKADPRETVPDETKRQLTKRGIKELKKMLPALKERLIGLNPNFFTSSLPRAAQTAGLIAGYLQAQPPEQADWVQNGDFEGLLGAYMNLDPALTPVVVGHEPYLSAWCLRLCGYELPFLKGSAAGLRITSQSPVRAEPEWTLLSGLPKTDPEGDALPESRRILIFKCHEVFACMRNFMTNPGDPEALHQFRIRIRSFRALLSFTKPLFEPGQYGSVRERMRRLTAGTGRLRALDVMRTEWTGLLKSYPLIKEGKSALLAVLDAQRRKELEIICADAPPMTETVFRVLKRLQSTPDRAAYGETFEPEKPPSFQSFAKKRFAGQLRKINAALRTIGGSDYSAIHELRKRIKKLRYSLEAFGPLPGLKKAKTVASLAKLQDIFGAYCDAQQTLAFIEEINGREENPEMRYESSLMSGYQIRTAEENLTAIRHTRSIR